MSDTQKKRFSLPLIKPSHYDDDGYVIQWFRSTIPSNPLPYPRRFEYMDLSFEPVTEHEEERELFQSDAAKSYVDLVHRNEQVRRKASFVP